MTPMTLSVLHSSPQRGDVVPDCVEKETEADTGELTHRGRGSEAGCLTPLSFRTPHFTWPLSQHGEGWAGAKQAGH